MTAQAPIPVLETERLILRGPEPEDFEPLAEFHADGERSIALAERLGAVFERACDNSRMGKVLLYRHPNPEAAA